MVRVLKPATYDYPKAQMARWQTPAILSVVILAASLIAIPYWPPATISALLALALGVIAWKAIGVRSSNVFATG